MSEWTPLSALPDLRRVDIIALDTETRDGGTPHRPRIRLGIQRRTHLRHQRCLSR